MRPPRHLAPPRFHAALGYVATADFVFGGAGLAVALGLTLAPQATHVRPLTPAEIHTTGAPPTVTAGAVSTAVAWDPGKDSDGTAPTRACRCEPRQPVTVGLPSVTSGAPSLTGIPTSASQSRTVSVQRTTPTNPGLTPIPEETQWPSEPADVDGSGAANPSATAAPATSTSAQSTASTSTAEAATASTPLP